MRRPKGRLSLPLKTPNCPDALCANEQGLVEKTAQNYWRLSAYGIGTTRLMSMRPQIIVLVVNGPDFCYEEFQTMRDRGVLLMLARKFNAAENMMKTEGWKPLISDSADGLCYRTDAGIHRVGHIGRIVARKAHASA